MNDLAKAIATLDNNDYTCVLCKESEMFISQKRGIAPLLDFIEEETDLTGFSAADRIVGKAAAMLYAYLGVVNVYGEVMSSSAVNFFDKQDIEYSYKLLTDKIINRENTGICPMERCVKDIDDINKAYHMLREKREQLLKRQQS